MFNEGSKSPKKADSRKAGLEEDPYAFVMMLADAEKLAPGATIKIIGELVTRRAAHLLKKTRKDSKLTQRQLADKLGVVAAQVSRIEATDDVAPLVLQIKKLEGEPDQLGDPVAAKATAEKDQQHYRSMSLTTLGKCFAALGYELQLSLSPIAELHGGKEKRLTPDNNLDDAVDVDVMAAGKVRAAS